VGYLLRLPTTTVAYLTDTTVAGSRQHVASLHGIDLLMHEWYFPDGYESMAQETGHSCLGQVLRLGREVQPKRLLLIHLNPLMNSAKSWGLEEGTVGEPPTLVAEDLLELQID
jgi:ribonuclease BN (tRNA processing enzyme)